VLIVSPFSILSGCNHLAIKAGWAGDELRRDYPTFNNRRLLEPVENIPPAEAEKQYFAIPDDVSMAT